MLIDCKARVGRGVVTGVAKLAAARVKSSKEEGGEDKITKRK